MRNITRLSFVLLIIGLIALHAPATRAEPLRQPPPLPADLLFTAKTEEIPSGLSRSK